jgi:hypothetical protein
VFDAVRTRYAALGLHARRWTVVVAAAVTTMAFLYVLLHRRDDVYAAFTRALLAGALTMAAMGAGERFWRGKKVKRAGLSNGGPTIEFEDQIATAVAQINERMYEQISTINERLYELEKSVFRG